MPDTDASILYYDGDYPSLEIGEPRAEDVAILARIGILGDVAFYKEQAAAAGGPVLEIGCGTGRLTIPLARLTDWVGRRQGWYGATGAAR